MNVFSSILEAIRSWVSPKIKLNLRLTFNFDTFLLEPRTFPRSNQGQRKVAKCGKNDKKCSRLGDARFL